MRSVNQSDKNLSILINQFSLCVEEFCHNSAVLIYTIYGHEELLFGLAVCGALFVHFYFFNAFSIATAWICPLTTRFGEQPAAKAMRSLSFRGIHQPLSVDRRTNHGAFVPRCFKSSVVRIKWEVIVFVIQSWLTWPMF